MVKSEISYNSPDQYPENNTLDIELMDFNGDGLSDIFMVQNKHVNPAFPEITTFFYRAHLYLNLSTSLVGDDQIAINVAKPFSNPEDHFLGYRTYMSIFSGGNNFSNPEPFSKCFTLKGDFSGYGKNEFLLFPFSGHLFSGTTLHTFNFEGKDHLLSSIKDGQSNETILNFKNLNNNQPSTQFFEIFNYPPSNIEDNVLSFSYNELNNQTIFSPGITQNGIPSNNTFSSLRSGFVVSSVSEKNSSCPSGNCFEKYTYQRPIFNAANGAFVGFGKTIKRSLDNYKTVVEKVFNFQNITYGQYVFPRVFLKEKTTKTYPSESTLFLESKDINNCVVQNGKYLILPSSSTNTNHFDNVKKEIIYTVDQTYGNITTSTATVKEAGVVLQTEITNKVFSIGNYTNWHKNNITKITKTLQRQGEEAFIEETDFIYNNLDQLDTKTQFASSNPIVSNYTYFAAGVLKKQTVNYANEILENSEILEYNPQYIYPTKTKNNAGWISSKLIDPFYGKTIKETDINGLESNFEYNSAGYLIKSISPTGVNTHYSYEWIELNGNELGAHKNNTWETNPNNSTAGYKTIIKDEKNRVILQGSLILGGNLNFVAKTYNQKNQLFKESIPMIGNANNFIDPYTSAGSYTFKVMSYNNKNELIGISNDVVNGNVAISREPLKEIITNTSTSRTTTKNFDGLGNVKSIIDPMGSVVTYNYTSTGKLKTITAEGATTTNSYHPQLDYLQSTNHPNKGLTEFLEFDKKFRPKKKKDANNNIEEYTYDNLDRITKTKYTAGNANGSSYEIINTYDLQSNNKGKISRIASEKQTENFVYDGFSNLVSHTSLIPGEEPALNQYSYDIFGREVERIFPDGIVQRTIYNLGFVEHILVNSSTVWRAGQLNRWGKYKNYFGGSQSQQTVFTYDDSRYDLYLTGINNSGFRNSSYNFQSYTGNLLDRNDEINQQHERFTYDNLDRLLTVSKIVNEEPILQKTFTFASNGNIETKSDVGQYEYGSKPHAITDVKNFAEPFPVSLHTQTIEYNEMLMPKKINENEGQYELEIFYGNAPQRVKSTLKHDGQLQKTILYYGDYEIEKTINEPQRNLHYIIAPTGIAAIIEKKENLNYPIIYNTFTDYLGSLTHIVESGTLVDEISYDAWGRKRNPANIEEYEEDMETQPSHIFSRGYTFHEHLNEFKLINMNARLYDPTLGRMLSPDNFVTDASNSQDYNSYSYARNNPLKFTDPTGNVVQSNPSWGNDGASSNELGGANVYGYFSSLEAREERAFGMHILILVSQLEEELNERNQAEQANNNQVTNNQVNSINETISGEASTETGTKVPNETGGEVDYSNRAAKEFMSKYLGLFDFVANLFADYSTPEGYTLTDGGKVFLGPDGEKGWGATIKNTNATTSNIFFAEGAFDSKEKLYLVMGHEIIHAASNYLGLDNGDFQEYAARQWAYKQAKEWNSSSLDGWRKNFEEIKFIRNLNGNNSPLLRPYIKSGVKIKSKYPW
ncbi:MAG: RHS repeat domain-containing protein [Bacteroidota bacterium]